MLADNTIQEILAALHGEPNFDDDLGVDELPLGPVSRLSALDPEPRVEFESFHPETKRTPEFIDKMTSTAKEDRIAEETLAGSTIGSPGSFQAAQAANMPSEKRWFKQQNGLIAADKLVKIEGGTHALKPAAARAYKAMQRAARKDGINFAITDSYRDLATQERLAEEKGLYSQGGLAAEPGTSNHGWGLALDINVNDPETLAWLQRNGDKYGFKTIPREPWHWEYKGGFQPTRSTRKQPRRKQDTDKQGYEQTDAMTLTRMRSSSVLGPLSFASVLGEMRESKPQTRRQYESHKKAQGLAFVPKQYRSLFSEAADRYNLPARLLAAVASVSNFNPKAVSSAGAQGMMQVMPLHGLDKPFNAKANVFKGAEILASYIDRMGSVRAGLAAYNGGPQNPQYDYADTVLQILRGEA